VSEFQWDQLREAEVAYSSRVSFDKVMEMREDKKKRRALIWWFTSLGLLFVGLGSSYFLWPSSLSTASSQVALNPSASSIKESELPLQKRELTPVESAPTLPDRAGEQIGQGSVLTERGISKPNRNRGERIMERPVDALDDLNAPWLKESAAASKLGFGLSSRQNQRFAVGNGADGTALQGREDIRSQVYSLGLTPSYAEWLDPFALRHEYFDDRLLPDNDLRDRFKPNLYAEFTAFTGSHNAINFDNRDNLSVLGTQYHAHYQFAILKDLGNGHLAGMGLAYGEWVGNGQYRDRQWETFTQIDTFHVVVMIPGQPVQTVEVIDTNTFTEWSETTGTLNYKISKVSIPLAYRYYLPLGKSVWRLSAQMSPGMTTRTEGSYFSRTEYLPLSVQRQFTFDGRLAFGPTVPISNVWTIVLEPNLFAQSFVESQTRVAKAKLFSGFGVSLVGKL
jgi:hypothetical protein